MARRPPSPEGMLEASRMGRRILLTMQFIENRYGAIRMSAEYRAMIQQAMEEGDRRDLKLLAADFAEMVTGLTRDEREGLEALLKQELGIDADADRAELSRQVAKSIARG